MAKHTRIYTRTGDDGTTGLYSGERVSKTDARVEAYGTVDELSSAIGVARAQSLSCHPERSAKQPSSASERIDAWLAWAQDKLFDLGAELATPSGVRRSLPAIADDDVAALERAIDESEAALPSLDHFIHAGGSTAGAHVHLARTICRRAERRVIALRQRDASVDARAVRFLNRLGDALFVWARRVNAIDEATEQPWRKQVKPPSPTP